MEDPNVFEGKTFSQLLQDIYENSVKKKKQIDVLIKELTAFIKTSQDAALVVPLIKEYLDVGVKNDELLIKMATVFQRHTAVEKRGLLGKVDGENSLILTEEERNELMRNHINAVNTIVDEVQDEMERIDEDLEDIIKRSEIAFGKKE